MAGPVKNKPRIFYGWYMVAALMFIALVTTGARNAFGVFVIPMEEEFGWNRTTVTAAGFIGAVVAGVIQPFLGRIFDATGGRKIVILGLIGVGVTLILLSLTFHIIFLVLMFGVFASVSAGGVSINNTSAMLARWFRRRRATVMGMNAAGASLGGIVMVPFPIRHVFAAGHQLAAYLGCVGCGDLGIGGPVGVFLYPGIPCQARPAARW